MLSNRHSLAYIPLTFVCDMCPDAPVDGSHTAVPENAPCWMLVRLESVRHHHFTNPAKGKNKPVLPCLKVSCLDEIDHYHAGLNPVPLQAPKAYFVYRTLG